MFFCANISTLFNDLTCLTEIFHHVLKRKDFRFDAIECQNPYELSIDQWKNAMNSKNSLKWILINSLPLYDKAKEIPTFEIYEKLVLQQTLNYSKFFDAKKVHLVMTDVKNDAERDKIIDLVYRAARFFEPHGILCLIEPLSTRENYYLRSYSLAIDIVRNSNLKNLKIMLDSFHLQRLHGNLTQRVQEMQNYVGHVQISQTPKRDCPMNEDGEVNHRYFINKLVAPFYKDYIGLEYIDTTDGSLEWLNEFSKTSP